ncbi:MAG: RidA family protein [Pseudohongiellaceae bacterium]
MHIRTFVVPFLTALGSLISSAVIADVERYPLPNGSTFPIAQAVEVKSGNIVFLSGATPAPADADAGVGNPAYYGDTKTQTISVLNRIKQNLEGMGLDMGDVIKLQVFLVGDPENEGNMDFSGFMEGYTQFFGTQDQPNLPSRSAFQIASLVAPLMFVEIEATAVRD